MDLLEQHFCLQILNAAFLKMLELCRNEDLQEHHHCSKTHLDKCDTNSTQGAIGNKFVPALP